MQLPISPSSKAKMAKWHWKENILNWTCTVKLLGLPHGYVFKDAQEFFDLSQIAFLILYRAYYKLTKTQDPIKISSHLEKNAKHGHDLQVLARWLLAISLASCTTVPDIPATLAFFLVLQMSRGWCCATNFCICCWGTSKHFLKWLDHFTVPLAAVHGCPNFSMSSPTLVIIMSLNLTSQCVWRGICRFNLHLLNDEWCWTSFQVFIAIYIFSLKKKFTSLERWLSS